MVADGVVKSVECSATIVNNEYVSLSVTLVRPDGEQENPFVYELKWKATDGI